MSTQTSAQNFKNLKTKSTNQELITWVEERIISTMIENDIPAVSIGVINEGKILMQKGFGFQNREKIRTVDENSLYQIASDTKKMTGIIVKNLVSEKKLKLNQPITSYLSDLLSKEANEKLKKISIADLLYHKSGVPYKAPSDSRIDGQPMTEPYTEKNY